MNGSFNMRDVTISQSLQNKSTMLTPAWHLDSCCPRNLEKQGKVEGIGREDARKDSHRGIKTVGPCGPWMQFSLYILNPKLRGRHAGWLSCFRCQALGESTGFGCLAVLMRPGANRTVHDEWLSL